MITIFAVTMFIAGILFVREEILSAGAKEELEERKQKAEICRRERIEWEKGWKKYYALSAGEGAKRPELPTGKGISEGVEGR